MADALLSPAVGISFMALSGGALALSAKKLKESAEESKVPLMGVLGAFVFASQMINFTIPGTGSSGHLVGGILLMILLGPYAGFITVSSVLVIQALFFADGGLLALGANIWNMAFYTSFVGWLIYKSIVGKKPSQTRISLAVIIACVVCLELGALSVVGQTILSGISELPFKQFVILMMGIHLPIGLIEGIITVGVLNLVYRIRPGLIQESLGIKGREADALSYRSIAFGFALSAMVIGGGVAWFASSHPDGLEWSIFKSYGEEELPLSGKIKQKLAQVQEKISLLPDYGFKAEESEEAVQELEGESWPNISLGTSVAGILGSIFVLVIAGGIGVSIARLKKKKNAGNS